MVGERAAGGEENDPKRLWGGTWRALIPGRPFNSRSVGGGGSFCVAKKLKKKKKANARPLQTAPGEYP